MDTHTIIKDFFKENLSHFSLTTEYSYFRYWSITYTYQNLKIQINEEIGIIVKILIDETPYDLWQYDRNVNGKGDTSKENILYQLNVLKSFLNEIEY
jgi:hypothetical protein